ALSVLTFEPQLEADSVGLDFRSAKAASNCQLCDCFTRSRFGGSEIETDGIGFELPHSGEINTALDMRTDCGPIRTSVSALEQSALCCLRFFFRNSHLCPLLLFVRSMHCAL